MVDEPALTFAGLLRRLRAETRLTQEELAEAAGLSPRSVSDLERGINRTARKETAVLLARALGLPGAVAELFVAAARGRGLAEDVVAARQGTAPGAFAAAATRGLPRDVASFTGRRAELDRLAEGLDGLAAGGGVVGICAIGGMAGVGKTTFAVHAAHRLAGSFPDGQFYLPLHGHTRGQRPVDPADALSSLLLTAGVPATQVPPGLEARAARWRDHVAGKKILLLLDDAASHEQVRPLLPGTGGSLVLVTSRRRLTALDDAAVISLDTLAPQEAAALLVRLAGRPGLQPADRCGRRDHPAVRVPAAGDRADRQPVAPPPGPDRRERGGKPRGGNRPAGTDAGRESVGRGRLRPVLHRPHPGQQRLFRRLGLIPGPTFDAYAAAALDGASLGEARRQLDELYDQHLITEPALGRYQLHDLLREHARIMAAGTGAAADSEAAAGRLLDYYLHTARAADQYFVIRASTYRRPRPGNPPAQAPDLSTLGQAAAWLEAERANLHAAADYAAARGRSRHAIAIPAAMSGFLAARGHWDQSAALHQSALAAARQGEDRPGEAETLSILGALQRETGDYPAAAASLARALALYRDVSDQPGQADALNELGYLRTLTGEYPAAVTCHQQALVLVRGLGDRRSQAWTLSPLGLVQHLTGDYPAAAASQQQALALFRDLGDLHGQARALNDLAVVQQETGDYRAAAASQQQALALFRDLGHRLGQAHALNDLGLVQQETGDYRAAAASHQQALALFGDLGNLLGQAEALNRLGELSLRTSATAQARDQHSRALAIARDISAAPEEARALEGIGHSHLQEGNLSQAVAPLRQALTIYQRIGAPGAERVQETLRRPNLPGSAE